MTYEITERDFLNMLSKERCLGKEVEQGTAKEGHDKCNHCKGNYFVGGQCNYGGQHLMSNDLKILNQNFKDFEILENRQIQLTTAPNQVEFEKRKNNLIARFKDLENRCDSDGENKKFFDYTCIATTDAHSAFFKKMQINLKLIARGLKRYRQEVEASTWEKLQEFKKKEEQLEKMQTEANRIMEEWKNETDPAKKRNLFAALTAKRNQIATFQNEMKKDPSWGLFSEERGNELGDIVRKLWQGETEFLKFQEKEKDKGKQDKLFGFIPKKYAGKLKWGAIIIVIVLLVWLAIWWIIRKIK